MIIPRHRVLIVDDSALLRKLLTDAVAEDPQFEVVGTAADGSFALRKFQRLRPDVVTLDIEMPQLDGWATLERVIAEHAVPVVVVAGASARDPLAIARARRLGAADCIPKPLPEEPFEAWAAMFRERLKGALGHKRPPKPPCAPIPRRHSACSLAHGMIAIGASTGGTVAIETILVALPDDLPPIVITQHIPPQFSRSFAQRLDQQSRLRVSEAEEGEPLLAGHAYVAPGDRHLVVRQRGGQNYVTLSAADPVHRHRPSVDVMFESVAASVHAQEVVGVLLSGMGRDGARGLSTLHGAGAATAVQDRQTSIVWSMPSAALDLGAAQSVLPLPAIAAWIVGKSRERT